MTKKIAVALPYAVSIRDFVNSGALAELMEDERIRVSIYTLNPNIPELDAMRRDRIEIHEFKPYLDSRVERLLKTMYPLFFIDQFAYVRLALSDRPMLRFLSNSLSGIRRVIGTPRLLELIGKLLLVLIRLRQPASQLGSEFCLFIGTRSLINSLDYGLIAEATRRGVPVMTIAGSWDNFTTKGYFPFPAIRTVVWNRKMHDELLDLFSVPVENISIAGYPRAALLRNSIENITPKAYLERIGIDGYTGFVLYSASYGELTRVPQQPIPLEYIAIEKVCKKLLPTLPDNICVLIRMHPFSKESDNNYFESLERCFVYVPGRQDKYVERVMGMNDECHLAMQIAKAECIVSMASTISLDALSLQKPVLNIDFDPIEGLPYTASIRRFYEFNHFRDLVRIARLPLASSTDEVVAYVHACLAGAYKSPIDVAAFEKMYVPNESNQYSKNIRKIIEELIYE